MMFSGGHDDGGGGEVGGSDGDELEAECGGGVDDGDVLRLPQLEEAEGKCL